MVPSRKEIGFGCALDTLDRFCILVFLFEYSSHVLDCVRSKSNCHPFLQRDVFIITATSAIVMCKMHLFSGPQKQLHHHMGKRDVDFEELAFTCLRAPATALYPSTTFAMYLTSSQRNKCGI